MTTDISFIYNPAVGSMTNTKIGPTDNTAPKAGQSGIEDRLVTPRTIPIIAPPHMPLISQANPLDILIEKVQEAYRECREAVLETCQHANKKKVEDLLDRIFGQETDQADALIAKLKKALNGSGKITMTEVEELRKALDQLEAINPEIIMKMDGLAQLADLLQTIEDIAFFATKSDLMAAIDIYKRAQVTIAQNRGEALTDDQIKDIFGLAQLSSDAEEMLFGEIRSGADFKRSCSLIAYNVRKWKISFVEYTAAQNLYWADPEIDQFVGQLYARLLGIEDKELSHETLAQKLKNLSDKIQDLRQQAQEGSGSAQEQSIKNLERQVEGLKAALALINPNSSKAEIYTVLGGKVMGSAYQDIMQNYRDQHPTEPNQNRPYDLFKDMMTMYQEYQANFKGQIVHFMRNGSFISLEKAIDGRQITYRPIPKQETILEPEERFEEMDPAL